MLQNVITGKEEKSGELGFTLVEVLIVVAIFSIGILAVASMQITAVKGNASARRVTEATALAENQLEILLELPYDHNDLDPDLNPHQISQSPYEISWNITETDLDGDGIHDSKRVDITVGWSYHGDRNVSMGYIIPEI